MNLCSIISVRAFWLVTIGFSGDNATCRGDETPPTPDVATTDVDVARKIINQPGLETLSERMMDRAVAIGRQLPDKTYLAALLYE